MLFKRFSHIRLPGFTTRIVLLLSLILAAFAHTVPSQQIKTPIGIDHRAYAAQFTLPDGTLPIICERIGDGGTHHPYAMPCEFCTLADNAVFLPAFSNKFALDCGSGLEDLQLARPLTLTKNLHGLHGASRAPPRV